MHFFSIVFFQFFYLITETYKLGTLKEMQRWAYEIHSSFLVPGAPLLVSGMEQSAIEEIDRYIGQFH
jgi:Rho guanine nucleotide exchange factor 12